MSVLQRVARGMFAGVGVEGLWTGLNGLDFDVRLYLSRGGDIQHTCG